MKRALQFTFILLASAAMFSACSSTKNANSLPRKDFKGNWTITSARVEGTNGEKVNVTAFDEADLHCFEGSEWIFPNNGYGSFTINQQECPNETRQILWSTRDYNGITHLNFKYVDGLKKKDSKNVAEGYSLEVSNFDGNHFEASSAVDFEGKTIYIVYGFDRR